MSGQEIKPPLTEEVEGSALSRMGVNRTVIALSVARMGDALGNSILFIVLPLYVDRLSAPWFPFPESVRVGILLSLYGFVSALFQPTMGALSDFLGRRRLLIEAGLVLMGVSTIGFIWVSDFSNLLLLRSLQGVGVALTIPASMALMTLATEKKNRGGAMGVYSTMRMVGFALGPLLGGVLQTHFGFASSFYAGAAFILIGWVLVRMWVREIPSPGEPDMRPRFQLFDAELLNAGIIGLTLATFVMATAFSMMTTLENQFNERLHETALGFSVAFSALMVSRLIFQLPLGRLSDKIGRKPLILAGLIIMAPATLLLGLVGTTLQLTGIRLLQGVGAAAIAAPGFALAADLSRSGGEGRQMSLITMGFGLGIAAGPLMAGLLAVHSFELPFIVGGIMALLGAGVVLRWVPETVHR